MRPTTFTFPVAIILIIVLISHSPSIAQVQGPRITKLIRISGLRGQLQYLPNAFLLTIPGDLFPDNRRRFDFNTNMKNEINTDSLVKVFQETFSENLDTDKLNTTIKFYESALGQKIGRIQGDVLSVYNIKAVREARRITTTLTEDRAKLLDRLINNQRIYQNNLTYRKLIVSLLGPENWNEKHKPKDDNVASSDYPETSFEKDPDFLHQIALTCFTYTYRSLTDPELESFAEFQETEVGAWFENKVSRGFEQVIIKMVEALDRGLINSQDRPTKN